MKSAADSVELAEEMACEGELHPDGMSTFKAKVATRGQTCSHADRSIAKIGGSLQANWIGIETGCADAWNEACGICRHN